MKASVVCFIIVLLLVGGCDSSPPTPGAVPPPDWKLSEILDEVYGMTSASGHILAWKVKEDDRPLYVESFIAVIEVDKTQYLLTHLFRHPRGHDSRWMETVVTDAPHVGSRSFDHPPNQMELLGFLGDTWWSFTEDPDWRILDVGLNTEEWENLTAQEPPEEFLRQITQAIGQK